ncbi:U1 small nuclear ribonucleoprotein-70K [Actinidia rufa]|uniref:U1 small nuclear ribonucleoprotein-70K n=1 Tax=Actinidia rufa TaxID=165716 RepID=A0A7J0DA67_9ERIC|nr:U1 small nuclear ribonucleoprotein-70K [Actinidia rufa]
MMEAVQKLDRDGATGKIVVLKKKTKLRKIIPSTILREISIFHNNGCLSIEEKKKPEKEIDRSIPEVRERGGATGNIVALKKKTKLGFSINFPTIEQLHRNMLMGRSLITEGCLWMLNVVELFQTGGLVDLVVDLVQLG